MAIKHDIMCLNMIGCKLCSIDKELFIFCLIFLQDTNDISFVNAIYVVNLKGQLTLLLLAVTCSLLIAIANSFEYH